MKKREFPDDVLSAVYTVYSFYRQKGMLVCETPGADAFQLGISRDMLLAALKFHKEQAGPKWLMDLWNEKADPRLKRCKKLTNARKIACRARLNAKETSSTAVWEGFIHGINNNDWCLGVKPSQSHPHWIANFDWFIKPLPVVRYLEGSLKQDHVDAGEHREGVLDDY